MSIIRAHGIKYFLVALLEKHNIPKCPQFSIISLIVYSCYPLTSKVKQKFYYKPSLNIRAPFFLQAVNFLGEGMCACYYLPSYFFDL